jgi:hypothetical protein
MSANAHKVYSTRAGIHSTLFPEAVSRLLMPFDSCPDPCVRCSRMETQPHASRLLRFLLVSTGCHSEVEEIHRRHGVLAHPSTMTLPWEVSHRARRNSTTVPSRTHSSRPPANCNDLHHVCADGLHREGKRPSCVVTPADTGVVTLYENRGAEVGEHGMVWYLNQDHPSKPSSCQH